MGLFDSLSKKTAQQYLNEGINFAKLERYKEAVASYDKALSINPNLTDAWHNRGSALGHLGRYEEAVASYDKALTINPNSVDAWKNRGSMLDDLGRYEEAAASCDKALSINPNFADAWVMRGVALGKLGQYSEVLTSSDKALTINPNSVEAWNNRGSALDDLGRYEEAVASYDKALTINPNYVDALSNRGNSLKKLGQYTEAFALNNKALAIEQQNREKEDRKIQIQPIKEIPQPFTPKKLPRDLSEKGLTHHDIIITYSNKDKPIADGVCASLESHSLRCWIAPRDVPPGEDFPKAIIKAINGSKIMILIFSSYSNTSPHVTRELTKAVSNGVIIIPFRIEDVPLSESMEYLIGLPHWLDAVTPPLENHIDKLVKTVDAILNK